MERKSLQQHTRSFDQAYQKDWRLSPTAHHQLIYRSKPFFKDRQVERILDVGCGRGFVLTQLALDGFDVSGTEICPFLMAHDLKKLPVSPFNIGGLGSFDDNDFDLVLMVDLLDHLRDDQEVDLALGHANRLAREGVIVTLGGNSDMRCVYEERDWWRGKLRNLLDFPMQAVTASSGVCRYEHWRVA